MNEREMIAIGKRLQDQARREVVLLQFMLQEADFLTWAKASQAGLTPNAGDRIIAMNRHRQKRAATEAEAREIIQRARRFYGSGEALTEFMQHALHDPAWALQNMRVVAKDIADESLVI